MTVSLKHKFTSAKTDGADTSVVRPSNWNDDHDLTLAASKLLGRATASSGAAEEITVGTSLSLDAATQTLRRSALTGDVTVSVDSNTTSIANDAVTTAKINNLAVTTAKIADLNVTTGKIADLGVTTGKINDLGVTTGKLADGAATLAKLDTTGTSGYVLTAQGSGVAPVWSAASGSGGMTLLGTVSTTSGTNPTISALTLTDYKQLVLVFEGVSHDAGTNRDILLGNSTSDDIALTESATASSGTLRGFVWIDLNIGTIVNILQSTAVGASTAIKGGVGDTVITTASTSLSFALSSTGNFDAGSIRVYGVK